MRKEFEKMDAELRAALQSAGSVEERERLVVENLHRKEADVFGGEGKVIPFKRPNL